MAKRILVVDDDPDLLEATKVILGSAGYEVATAASGTEMFAELEKDQVDLIILDVMLETETEGFHLAYKVREHAKFKDTPIIMLTCIEEKTGEILEPEKAGDFLPVQDFLRKPLSAKDLRDRVARLLA